MAELNFGVIVLPAAPLSPARRGGDVVALGSIGRGDATLMVGLSALVRPSRFFGFGAGVRFGPQPTADDQYGGLSGLSRTHSRSYLWLGAEARVSPWYFGRFETYTGLALGAVIIADRFVTNDGAPVPTVLGERVVTLATQGASIGVPLGVNWHFARHWTAGLATRPSLWFVPDSRACTPIGDCATLTGRVFALEVGLSVGYHIPL
jgi:hypothetical protein